MGSHQGERPAIVGRLDACRSRARRRPRRGHGEGKEQRSDGNAYNKFFGEWLTETGLSGIDNQHRYRALLCLENLPAIEAWRATLSEKDRDRLNHPGAVWTHWKQSSAEPALPRRQAVARASRGNGNGGRPVYFSQDQIRRAVLAIGESFSRDIFTLARLALEAAIRSEDDVDELLGAPRVYARKANGAAERAVA
jgi:hypothetical protein